MKCFLEILAGDKRILSKTGADVAIEDGSEGPALSFVCSNSKKNRVKAIAKETTDFYNASPTILTVCTRGKAFLLSNISPNDCEVLVKWLRDHTPSRSPAKPRPEFHVSRPNDFGSPLGKSNLTKDEKKTEVLKRPANVPESEGIAKRPTTSQTSPTAVLKTPLVGRMEPRVAAPSVPAKPPAMPRHPVAQKQLEEEIESSQNSESSYNVVVQVSPLQSPPTTTATKPASLLALRSPPPTISSGSSSHSPPDEDDKVSTGMSPPDGPEKPANPASSSADAEAALLMRVQEDLPTVDLADLDDENWNSPYTKRMAGRGNTWSAGHFGSRGNMMANAAANSAPSQISAKTFYGSTGSHSRWSPPRRDPFSRSSVSSEYDYDDYLSRRYDDHNSGRYDDRRYDDHPYGRLGRRPYSPEREHSSEYFRQNRHWESTTFSSDVGYPRSERIPYGRPASKMPVNGLPNLGNTCYINAAIQVLASLPFFVTELSRVIADHTELPSSSLIRTMNMVFEAVKDTATKQSYDLMSKMRELKETLAKKNPDFGTFSQQDAQELLVMALSQLQEDLFIRDAAGIRRTVPPCDDPVARTFTCEVTVETVCLSCYAKSTTTENYMDFSLSITSTTPHGGLPDVGVCFAEFFKDTQVDRECESCHHKSARIHRHISKLPRVLVMHLKRFRLNDTMTAFEKDSVPVAMPERLFMGEVIRATTLLPPLGPPLPPQTEAEKAVDLMVEDNDYDEVVFRSPRHHYSPYDRPVSSPLTKPKSTITFTSRPPSPKTPPTVHRSTNGTYGGPRYSSFDPADIEAAKRASMETLKFEQDPIPSQTGGGGTNSDSTFHLSTLPLPLLRGGSLLSDEASISSQVTEPYNADEAHSTSTPLTSTPAATPAAASSSMGHVNVEPLETWAEGVWRPQAPNTVPCYSLCGVISHLGNNLYNGHYIANTRTASRSWLCCDDSNVSKVSDNAVFTGRQRQAYILFYVNDEVMQGQAQQSS